MAEQNFVIPVMIDYSANAIIYGETAPDLSYDYGFSTVENVIDISMIYATFKYLDTNNDASGPYLKYALDDASHITMSQWHSLMVDNSMTITSGDLVYRNSDVAPASAKLGEHIVKWIASTLFGHPEAQAPITNDTEIIDDVEAQEGDFLGKQIYDQLLAGDASNGSLSNDVLLSMWEQLVNAGRFTDGSGLDVSNNAPPDTDGYQSFPYVVGDSLSFLIRIGALCSKDNVDFVGFNYNNTTGYGDVGTPSQINLVDVFDRVNGVNDNGDGRINLDQEVWKFTFKIASSS